MSARNIRTSDKRKGRKTRVFCTSAHNIRTSEKRKACKTLGPHVMLDPKACKTRGFEAPSAPNAGNARNAHSAPKQSGNIVIDDMFQVNCWIYFA